MKDIIKYDTRTEVIIPQDKLEYLQKELSNIRPEFADNSYIKEALITLQAGALRSTIGSYWNAVVDDLRRKITYRSLDLFNKEIKQKQEIKTYEDFQNHVTDNDLINGAYKIGVISWEGQKLLHQARETRNIFDGHPESMEPTLFKVFNMISDCNRYVLSQDYPVQIIDVNQYITIMDSDSYNKNDIAVEQAFIDLPDIYKTEMSNKLFDMYIKDNASTRLKSNIEYSYPILWKVLPKEIRQQIGKRFDKLIVEGNSDILKQATSLFSILDGLRYVSSTSRRILFEPAIANLENNLDNWNEEGNAVKHLQRLGSTVPTELISRFVGALTLTYVGYKGNSMSYARTTFYSDSAAPYVSEMFEKFDNSSAEAFAEFIKTSEDIQSRIRGAGQLNRLRTLGNILLNKPEIRDDTKSFLQILVDVEKTKEFYAQLRK
jgi:hypothetical protein